MVKLLKFHGNWADELDVFGMKLVTQEQFESIQRGLTVNGSDRSGWYFGSNEGFDDETWNDLWANVTVMELNDEDLNVITRNIFGGSGSKITYGNFPPFPTE